jgi:hypothetical protein
MDGSLINNYFPILFRELQEETVSIPLFLKAIYSQAADILHCTVRLFRGTDAGKCGSSGSEFLRFGVSPIFLNAGFQRLGNNKNYSYGASLGYSNLKLMQKSSILIPIFDAPQSINSDLNFRFKTKSGGFFKYYGNTIPTKWQ